MNMNLKIVLIYRIKKYTLLNESFKCEKIKVATANSTFAIMAGEVRI